MKIGITCYPTYGGSGAVATELGKELAERGHEVHFVSYAQPFRLGTFEERLYFHEVEMMPYPLFEYPPYSLALAVTLHEVVVEHGLDLLHVHYALPHATSGWITREMLRSEGADVKLVTTLHGTDITLVGQDPSFRSITRFSIERSDDVTAVSTWLREQTCQAFGCEEGEIRVIPNFIDPEVYDRDRYPCRRDALAPEADAVLMHISNFRPVKRVRDVVRIFAAVRDRVTSHLVMVGDGPERQAAAETAVELGVRDGVTFLGKVDSVAELLACADLFLLPSEEESFGLVALEALSSGVPVVGTEGSGLSEVVTHGESGRLHPVGAVDEMAASAVELLADRGRWERYSEAGRRDAVERFSADRVVPRYEGLYRDVLAGEGGAEPRAAGPAP
ncbi:MAG: N-acetyl-alpha-D-glucosaminyl L-malate synthase BshA [Gemmatimonadota bacterium]